jgi:hypothetical protein
LTARDHLVELRSIDTKLFEKLTGYVLARDSAKLFCRE